MPKCPNCGRKIKQVTSFVPYTVRCECGTRITLNSGFFRDKVIDWETPEERKVKTT